MSLFLVGCALPRFSMKPGGKGNDKEIPGKTIQVDFFENKSTLASSTVSTAFTEGLRDIMLSQTPLELVANNGGAYFLRDLLVVIEFPHSQYKQEVKLLHKTDLQ